jgi:hypothetical protein
VRERTRKPWTLLAAVSARRFTDLATDVDFLAHLDRCVADRHEYLNGPNWFTTTTAPALHGAACFSMKFGLGDALRSLPVASGRPVEDHKRSPVIGVDLMFQKAISVR